MGKKKRAIGRPKMDENAARSKVLSIRLSERELALIQSAVPKDTSRWARETLLVAAVNMPRR